MTDYMEADRQRRQDMEQACARLLDALRREHPRIIAHLTRNQRNRSN